MIEVTRREFIRNFAAYEDTEIQLAVVDQHGKTRGYYWSKPGAPPNRDEAKDEAKQEVQGLEPSGAPCQMCKKRSEYYGAHWEDGEEHLVSLCKLCYLKHPNKRNFKKL